MPLASRKGPPVVYPTPEATTQGDPPPTDQLDQASLIKDSFVNRTAFNPQTYAEEFGLLQRYAAGSRIAVTYFLRSTPQAGLQRSDAIDPSSTRSPLQTSYTEIRELEIVVQDRGLQSTFNADNRETRVHGVALLYPGMRPCIGDLFVTPMGDATFGVFQVSATDRLTYRQGSNHRINFFLREFASEDALADIRRSVTQTLYFERETYLGDATTLLKSDTYLWRGQLVRMRDVLTRHYYNTFYDKSLCSLVSPQGVYDPYLVAYLTRKISIRDSTYRPTQLYPAMQNYDNCLWARLTDITNRTLTGLQSDYSIQRLRFSRWDISITAAANHTLITLENPHRQAIETEQRAHPFPPPFAGQITVGASTQPSLELIEARHGYVLSPAFYSGDKTAMTPLEFRVYAVIRDRKLLELAEFIDGYLLRYADLTFAEQFYAIPLYLWLIDVGLDSIPEANAFMS